MGLAFGTDLTGKVAVVTGAGGVLCGMFAKTLAEAGTAKSYQLLPPMRKLTLIKL